MDEIKETEKPAVIPIKIYSARLIFRKIKSGKRIVGVQIRYSKKGRAGNKKIEFPEDIKEEDLCWKRYYEEQIAVYHRRDSYRYIDMNHLLIPTELGQKLERIVLEVYSKITNKDNKMIYSN